MRLVNPYREELRGVGDWMLTLWDSLLASIAGSWAKEHTDDDRHGHVHATTLQVGRLSFSTILTPAPFTSATIHNFNDERLRDAGLLRLSTTLAECTITGIQIPVDELGNVLDGRVLVIENASDTGVLILEHEHTGSTPANRFALPYNPASVTGATNRYFLPPKTMTAIVSDSAAARWLLLSRTHDEVMSYAEFGSNQNDYAPANFRAARVVRLVPTAANLTITGFSATNISAPSRKTIINEGIYRFAILHMNTGSTAANRVQCPAGSMYYLNPRESVDIYRETDGTWHIILKADQWVDVPFAAGNFTASAGSWTVTSDDQHYFAYQIDGNKMTVDFEIHNTDVSAAPGELRITVPAGRTIARDARNPISVADAGTFQIGICVATAGLTHLKCYANGAYGGWTTTAGDNTYVMGQITFMVETSCATVSELHTDAAHQDTAHADASHSDVAHVDTTHVDTHNDVAHADAAHGDSAHADAHSDVAHSDVAHEDVAHVDGAHQDTAHQDVAHDDQHGDENIDFQDGFIHQDQHIDLHFDTPHTDVAHADASHGDSHSDVAHVDVAHADTHSDAAHSDSGHSDTPHSDSHSDTPHADTPHTDGGHSDTPHADVPHTDVGYHCDTTHSDI